MIQLELQRRLTGLLLPRERILWAGRPQQGLMFVKSDLFAIPFVLVWAAIAVGMPLFRGEGLGELRYVLVILFGGVAAYMLVGRFVHDAWLRARTYYAVTDRRVLIWREGINASFKALDRAELDVMELKERGTRGTICFGPPIRYRRGRASALPSLDARPQFLGIEDARRVFALLQRTKLPSAEPGTFDSDGHGTGHGG